MRDLPLRGMAFLSCLSAVALTATAAGSAPEVAASLRAGNRVALEAIRTFHGKMRFEGKMSGAVAAHVSEVECWRRGNDVRQKEANDQHTNDVFLTGGRQTAITVRKEADGSKWVGAVINPLTGPLSGADLWGAALCIVRDPRVTLDDLLSGEHTLESAEYTGNGPKRRGRVSVKWSAEERLVIIVDPSANYMIEKVEHFQTGNHAGKRFESKLVREVESFAEVAPGIFFPRKVKTVGGRSGKEVFSSVVAFRDVVVNRPLPVGVFTMRFPRNVAVTDRIAGTAYQADEQGRPTSAVKKLGVHVPSSPPAPSETIPPTTEEPSRPWWPYALVVGGLGACASAWVVHRYRSKRVGPRGGEAP